MNTNNRKGLKLHLVLFCSLVFSLPVFAEIRPGMGPLSADAETLRYTVSYQGALSGSLPVEIARVSLRLHPGLMSVDGVELKRASLALTTELYPKMEALYPLRFDYDSWFDPEVNRSVVAEMRRDSSKPRHELLWFDQREGAVRRFRKGTRSSANSGLPVFLTRISRQQHPERFRERHAVKFDNGAALDRLAMLYAVRVQFLQPGEAIELAVSNGKDLRAYKIAVEAREQLLIAGKQVAALRVSFTPRFDSDDEEQAYGVRAWLSDDEQRIPLRFQGSGLGGVFVVNLDQRVDKEG